MVKFLFLSIIYGTCISFNAYGENLPASRTYEYGKRVDGDEINYTFNGVIPKFQPHADHIIHPEELRADLVKNFTYLRIDYASPLSFITFGFDIHTYTLTFYVKLPFVDIPFTITGYSVDKETWTNLEKIKNN